MYPLAQASKSLWKINKQTNKKEKKINIEDDKKASWANKFGYIYM